MAAPEWLTRREGCLKLGSDGKTWFVLLRDEPQYSIVTIPARGQHTCTIRQTINGRRIDCPEVYPSPEHALAGSLEELRKSLGWD